ncbi:MAG: alcohol dehydrogenase [Dehalococcoidia bacterium]|nr:alcohol dehydrogenase [Dehalococcoidia bacterium]
MVVETWMQAPTTKAVEETKATGSLPKTMKAVVMEQYGHVLWKEVLTPIPGPNDCLIEIKAGGCNYNDVWARKGAPLEVALPHIFGSDCAGIVRAIGSEVKAFKPGDEVLNHCGIPAQGNPEGQEHLIWGFDHAAMTGGHAQYAKIPAENLMPKPANLSWEEAAALPLVLVTVWRQLVTKGGIKPGDYVLIWGAAGGIGSIAVQVCKMFHAHAIAIASSHDKLEACKKLGADYLINRKTQDIGKEVRNIVGRRGVDIVFEHPGQQTINTSLRLVKWGGKVVISGATSGYEATIDLRHIFFRQVQLIGCTLGTVEEQRQALKAVEMGMIKPLVHTVLPMSRANEAYSLIEKDEAMGKVVLVPDSC